MGLLDPTRIRLLPGPWGWVIFLGAALIPILWTGLHQEIMEVDSAQYASMAREMLDGASLTQLTEHGQRYQSRGYPDKPPLIFWTAALGMKLIGPTEAGFRFFSWLAAVLGLWAVGNWARLLWGQASVGPTRWVYACNLGMLLMNVDLRTDSLLLSLTSLALWLGHSFMLHRGMPSLIGFTLALALALMAKGPIAAVAVVVGLVPAWPGVERRRRLNIDTQAHAAIRPVRIIPALLLVIIGVFLLLTPMLWGLYKQWGWHDGVRYYLWTQSFGRITGENPWANQPGPFFLTGSLAWSFLPWTPILLASIGVAVRSWHADRRNYPGIGALLGLILLTAALSSSAYQLPHYIYIVWPFAAVLCGRMLSDRPIKRFLWIGHHVILIVLLLASAGLLALLAAPAVLAFGIGLMGLMGLIAAHFIIRHHFKEINVLLARSVAVFTAVAATLILVFYPTVLPYQAGARAAQYHRSLPTNDPLWILGCGEESLHSMHFYSRSIVPAVENPTVLPPSAVWVYTDLKGKMLLEQSDRSSDSTIVFPFTRVTTLKPDFFLPEKREKVVENRYLIHIKPIFAPALP